MDGRRETFDEYVAQGEVLVLLDARQAGVDVPDSLRRADLALSFSQGSDLYVSDLGVAQTLVFGGVRRYVLVPWFAVYGIRAVGGPFKVWTEPAAPVDLAKRLAHLGLVA